MSGATQSVKELTMQAALTTLCLQGRRVRLWRSSPSPSDHSQAVPPLFQLNSESLHFGLQEIFGVVNPTLFEYRYSERRPINQKKKRLFQAFL